MALPPGWTYSGAFRVPDISANTDAETLNYSAPVIAYDPADGGLFISNKEDVGRVGKISTPTPSLSGTKSSLPRATVLQPLSLTFSRVPTQPFDDPRIGGLLVHGSSLYGAAYSYYNDRADFPQSHFKYASTLPSSSITGMYAVGPLSQSPRLDIVGGYMCHIPASQQADYGGPCLTGLAGIAIVGGASNGPALSVFDPATVGTSPYAPATPLVYYPEATPLTPWGSSNTIYFNGTSEIRGVMMDDAGDVFVFGSHGTGPFYYGQLNDARGDNSTTHAAPYRYQFWKYAKADLMAVKNGTKLPWEVIPVIHSFTLNFQTSACWAGGMAHDPATGRVWVVGSRHDGVLPLIHVFQVTVAPPADTTPPVITNIVDSVTETMATISWTTDELGDSRVEYGLTPSYGTIQVENVDTTLHSMTLTNLQPGTTYNYRVKSWDGSDNSATSANRTFTTLSPPPPVDPCAAVIAERDALLVQVADLQAEVTTLNESHNVLEAQLAQTEQLVAQQVTQISDLQSQVVVLNASVASLASQLAAAQSSLSAANAKIQNGLGHVNQAKAALE